MRIVVASFVAAAAIAAACGSAPKKESSIVNEGSGTAPTCCCKTTPVTDDKDIVPQYAMASRMECSTANGECVDDVQCNAAQPVQGPANSNTPPPPPTITPAGNDSPIQ